MLRGPQANPGRATQGEGGRKAVATQRGSVIAEPRLLPEELPGAIAVGICEREFLAGELQDQLRNAFLRQRFCQNNLYDPGVPAYKPYAVLGVGITEFTVIDRSHIVIEEVESCIGVSSIVPSQIAGWLADGYCGGQDKIGSVVCAWAAVANRATNANTNPTARPGRESLEG